MKKIEVSNFQNLIIINTKVPKTPLIQHKEDEEDVVTLVIIRDPYAYFDYLLFDYISHKRSILFTQEIIKQMKILDNHDFLKWFSTLNFIPFYNPQTFQLDVHKRLNVATEKLKHFDYVIPYEELDIFLANIPLDISISNVNEGGISFSLASIVQDELTQEFIEKDLELYNKAQELWNLIKKNNFQPLSDLLEQETIFTPINETENFRGGCGGMNEKMIRGFAFNLKKQTSLKLEIYKNTKLLCKTEANIPRADFQKQFNLTTDKCGFQVIFDKSIFKKGDCVDVVIVPENIRLPIVGDAKEFLGL